MMKTKILLLAFLSTVLLQTGCTEPYEIETKTYENVLVVESTITDELKQQIVKLSRTSALEDLDILTENNASVIVNGSNGESFNFSQDNETGFYISNQNFSAQPNVVYTLNIVTVAGKRYSSTAVNLPPAVEIGEVYAESIVSPTDNKDGIQVLVNTQDPTGNAKYFRYEYEETYKIVAPEPSRFYTEIINYNPETGTYEVILTDREREIICYSTEASIGITQTSTTELGENKVFRFPVRYLSKSDAKIQTRYSILVKQYVQSIEAFTFYKIIKDLGSIQSLLSQGQPGYVAGNMISEEDPNEKILGFFEAASMTSKRIYFNYENFGFDKPPYFVDCEILFLDYRDNTVFDDDWNEREIFYEYVTYRNYQVLSLGQETIYRIVQPECSVCTSFSSNIRPAFWED